MLEKPKHKSLEKIIFFNLKKLEKILCKLDKKLNDHYSKKIKKKAENALRKNLIKLEALNQTIISMNSHLPKLKKYPRAKGEAGYSCLLIYAAESGYFEMIKYLILQGGIDVQAKNPYKTLNGYTLGNCCGNSALINAARNGHREIIQFLLKTGVDIEIPINPLDDCRYSYTPDSCASNAIVAAIKNNHFDIIEFFFEIFITEEKYPSLSAILSNLALDHKKFMLSSIETKAALSCLTLQQGARESNLSSLPQEILNHIYSFRLPFAYNPKQRKSFVNKVSSLYFFKPQILSDTLPDALPEQKLSFNI